MSRQDFQTVLALVAIAAVQTGGCVGRAGSDVDARTPKAVRLVTVDAPTGAESTTYSAIITPMRKSILRSVCRDISSMSAESRAPTGGRGRSSRGRH